MKNYKSTRYGLISTLNIVSITLVDKTCLLWGNYYALIRYSDKPDLEINLQAGYAPRLAFQLFLDEINE